MNDRTTAYISAKLYAKAHPQKGGLGVFARASIKEGELLVVWGGDIVNGKTLALLPQREQQHSIQVEEDLYLVPHGPAEPADFVNHCCEPNAGLSGQISLVALRDIEPGEEVCFDYAMSDSSPYDEFDCECGAANCRGRVSGNDWRRPELWERYAGHFSPYLQRRINHLKQDLPVERRNGRLTVVHVNGRQREQVKERE